jgi:hypothetical protein
MLHTHDSPPEVLQVIRSEYLEMPGLHLTKAQFRRLWGIDEATCEGVLDVLVSSRFLQRTPRDGYVLASTGH